MQGILKFFGVSFISQLPTLCCFILYEGCQYLVVFWRAISSLLLHFYLSTPNFSHAKVDPKLTEQCVKNLVFIGRAMHLNPELCFAEDADDAGEEEESASGTETPAMDEASDSEGVDDDGGDAAAAAEAADASPAGGGKATMPGAADPLRWVFNRMSHMVVHKGEARRRAVFSWFLAMVAVHEPAVSVAHLKLMLLPLRRAVLDAEAGGVEHKAGGSHAGGGGGGGTVEKEQTAAELATEVSGWWRSKEEVPEWLSEGAGSCCVATYRSPDRVSFGKDAAAFALPLP